MSFRKSMQCVGKGSGQYVTEYDSFEEAQAGAEHVEWTHGRQFLPYQCDRCGQWHLTPRDRQTPSTRCSYCRGSNGRPKDAYDTERDAQRRADILHQEKGIRLRVYKCPHGHGWHLTKGHTMF